MVELLGVQAILIAVVLAPSAVPYSDIFPKPKELDTAGIKRIVAAFVAATKRALQAGFDISLSCQISPKRLRVGPTVDMLSEASRSSIRPVFDDELRDIACNSASL